MNRRLLPLAALLMACQVSSVDTHAAVLNPFRGVVGVRVEGSGGFLHVWDLLVGGTANAQTAEAQVGDTIDVRVRELDGWLIAQMQKHLILGENYFSVDQYRRWLELAAAFANASPRNNDHFGQWVQSNLANPKNPDLDLFQAYDGLRQEIWQNFYLLLGNGRLKQINAERPYDLSPRTDAAGIMFTDVRFIVTFSPADQAEWEKISRGARFRVPLPVRIGFDNGVAQYTLNTVVQEATLPPLTAMPQLPEAGGAAAGGFLNKFCFIAYSPLSMVAGVILVALTLVPFVLLAAKTGIVRDPDMPPRKDGRLQFNLARCQMAFWFLLFAAAYIFLWVVKGQTDTITDQCLELLGISAGTTISSALISKSAAPGARWDVYCPFNDYFRRFFWEILSDGMGKVTFYRFQMVVWTLVLGMVFIENVAVSLAMPTFGSNELALMGISAGTYLAFKFPEHSGEKNSIEEKA